MKSDRNFQFISEKWDALLKNKRTLPNKSSPDSLKTDRKSENALKTLLNLKRELIQDAPKVCNACLPELEFEFYSSKNASTKLTLFKVHIERVPRRPFKRSLSGWTRPHLGE